MSWFWNQIGHEERVALYREWIDAIETTVRKARATGIYMTPSVPSASRRVDDEWIAREEATLVQLKAELIAMRRDYESRPPEIRHAFRREHRKSRDPKRLL